jgi:anti-anti-sigma factor
MNNELEIILEKHGRITVFDIQGDVTVQAEPFFSKAYDDANEQGTDHILLKFYEATYINSGGIAVLIQLLSKTKKNNQSISITGLSEHFKKIFNMVGITKFARIYNTMDEVMADLAGES